MACRLSTWEDEYAAFKEICHEMRTTPTAKLNELMREAPENRINGIVVKEKHIVAKIIVWLL